MLSESGGWIYTFAVTDTETHKDGYTIYKITSIVFPRQLPQTLNCLVVWRRFHDVKRLYRELKNRYKNCQLPGQVPQPTSCNYFKRFDENAIKKRKKYILDLLNFAAQYPELYKCYSFNQFLYDSALPVDTLRKDHLDQDCISNSLVNMTQDINSSKITAVFKDFTPAKSEIFGLDFDLEMESIGVQNNDWTSSANGNCDENDFVYKAAIEFSTAVQAEVNQDYVDAYAAYRRGIEQLQKCCDCDVYKETNLIIQAKIDDYLRRAEKVNNEIQLRSRKLGGNLSFIDELERPWKELYQFKVVSILHEKLMVVLPHNKENGVKYVLKCIDKSIEADEYSVIRLPRNVLYMLNLVCYFQNKSKLFVLLPLVPGGRLIDLLHYHSQFKQNDMKTIKTENIIVNVQNKEENAKNEFENLIESSKQLLESVTKTLENLRVLQGIQSIKTRNYECDDVNSSIKSVQKISEQNLKRWACELLVAINNLHENGVILRDLQTKNLLLGENGNLLLSFFYVNEFNVIENCEDCRMIDSKAIENHFVAPERPLSFKSDWWSYGIILYEILTGITFRSAHPGSIDLYGFVQFPEQINLSAAAYDLINNLLQLNPESRLDYSDIKNHSFFKDTDWDAVKVNGKPLHNNYNFSI